MPRRPQKNSPEALRRDLIELLNDFENRLRTGDLREKVLSLVPAIHKFRDLGSSLIPEEYAQSAQDRILHYFLSYPNEIVSGDEIAIVSGIQEYARRIRELRVELGWKIYSGETLKELCEAEEADAALQKFARMKKDEYAMTDVRQDRDAAYRWNRANAIRREKTSARNKILTFLQENVERPVSGEELRYVSGNTSEWARRIRELRTEEGWSISSKASGRADLPVGVYVLESLRQLPPHDRTIPDDVRRRVLERDRFQCVECGWSYERACPADPRHNLELHHRKPHAEGGENVVENLATLCNVCHDQKHAKTSKK